MEVTNFLTDDDKLDIEKLSYFVRNPEHHSCMLPTAKIKIRDKYRMISLFVPPEHRKTIKSQERNHSSLKKDKMTYLLSEAFVKLFLSVCKLYANPINIKPEDQTRLNPGAFRRLIEGVDLEIQELNEEIERLESKNLKGYMLESDHHKIMEEKINSNMILSDKIKKLEKQLEEQEKYYKEKISKQIKRHSEGQQYLTKEVDKLSKEVIEY